jgi:hypothetical protein
MYPKKNVLLLGLVVLLAGMIPTVAAHAEAGPLLEQRENAKSEEQEISEAARMAVQGEGGEQILRGSIGKEKTAVEISAKEVQIKGIVYDNNMQGQVKLEITFHHPKIIKPVLESCEVKIGENNTVSVRGHLAWKWNGLSKQLEEEKQEAQKPDWIFLHSELEEGATVLPSGELATITIPVLGCGVFGGLKLSLEGSLTGEISSAIIGEWGSFETVKTTEGKKSQHFWNGKKAVGVETGLVLGGNPASLIGETKIKIPNEEEVLIESPYYFQAMTYPATITAPTVGNHKIKAAGEAFECATVSFSGSLPMLQDELSLAPTYAMCGAFTVVPNTCKWKFGPTMGNTSILPSGCEIKMVNGGCEIKVPGQSDVQTSSIGYTNVGAELEIKMRVTRLTYTAAGCTTNGTRNNGEFEGKVKASAGAGNSIKRGPR